MYPPVPSIGNVKKSREVNVTNLKKKKSLENMVLTKKQLMLRNAKKQGLVFEKKPSVAELHAALHKLKSHTSPNTRTIVTKKVVKKASPVAKILVSKPSTIYKSPVLPRKMKTPLAFSPSMIKNVNSRENRKYAKPMSATRSSDNIGSKRFLSRSLSSTKMVQPTKLREIMRGPCGNGPVLDIILSHRGLDKKKFEKLPVSEQMNILRDVEVIDEQLVKTSFFKDTTTGDDLDARASSGRLNMIREHFVCISLFQISKKYTPNYKTKEVADLFSKLKKAVELAKLDIVDVIPAGGQGKSHDFELLLKGRNTYSSMEFKATQTKCSDEEQPWSCTPQFYALSLKNANILKTPNEGEQYLRGWYTILQKLDSEGNLFTPPGDLPPYNDYVKDVYRMEKPGGKFVQRYIVFWKQLYDGMRGRIPEGKRKKELIDNEMRKYTNSFLKKHVCDLNMTSINNILKKNITGKDYWLTWSTKASNFKIFKGTKTAFIGDDGSCPSSSVTFVESKGKKVGFDKFILQISGIYLNKPTKTFLTLNIYWGNRTMNPCWRFGFVKKGYKKQ